MSTEQSEITYEALRRRSCLRKKEYKSKREALAVAKKRSSGHPYFCTFCGWWHIGRWGFIASLIESQRPAGSQR